jgi:hypothetical protein
MRVREHTRNGFWLEGLRELVVENENEEELHSLWSRLAFAITTTLAVPNWCAHWFALRREHWRWWRHEQGQGGCRDGGVDVLVTTKARRRTTANHIPWPARTALENHGRGCRSYSALQLAVTNDIRHQPACGQLLGLMQLGLQLLSEGNSR